MAFYFLLLWILLMLVCVKYNNHMIQYCLAPPPARYDIPL